jgi:cobalt/nickel transport system permease protein
MHLGNGAITPECAALTYGVAAAGLGASLVAIRRTGLTSEKLRLAAGFGGFVLAAQAINVPIAPGTSAHLVGGVLLASILGPGLGAWTMTVVLAIQSLALGDGGIAALGANVLNMALVPAGVAFAMRRLVGSATSATQQRAAQGAAASLAVVLAASLIVVETALFRSAADVAGWTRFAGLMLGAHIWIGVLEGFMTVALIAAFAAAITPAKSDSAWRLAICGAAVALLIVIWLPLSSSLPDGYETAARASGMSWLLSL